MIRRATVLSALAAAFAFCCATPSAVAQDAEPAPIAPITEPVPPRAPSDVTETAPAADASPLPGGLEESLRDLAPPIRLTLMLTVLIFIPSLLLCVTSYTRIIIVLSFIRRAIGAQELPPNPILVGLALFLTVAVMSPTFARVNERALSPFLDERMSLAEAGENACAELRTFLLKQTREEDLLLAIQVARAERPASPETTPLTVAIPAFVLSELRAAFRMGFLVFLPFVLIDLVVASVLLALGMFMLPPTMIAMPLKILLFVLVDGWSLVIQSLALSFET